MKKLFAILLAIAMVVSLAACGGKTTPTEAPTEKPTDGATDAPTNGGDDATDAPTNGGDDAEGVIPKKIAFICPPGCGMSNPFTQLCWQGFEHLEQEGWETKVIECTETTEFADNIRAMAAGGYEVIVTLFDGLAAAAVELSDELYEAYPNLRILMADTYYENNTKNCVNIICDPWESSFVAGYVAANMTEKSQVGWIGSFESLSGDRFRYGYQAGVAYANNGKTVVEGYTGDPNDAVKGEEACKTMLANNDVDIIYQTANLSGIGVITAGKDAGIKVIGVDKWQGGDYGQETVFWSALKPIDEAIYASAVQAYKGELNTQMVYFDVAHGAQVYDQRDFDLLPADVQAKVKQLTEDISSGKIDVYAGYEDYRFNG